MKWRVIHLAAQATQPEGWRTHECQCNLRKCGGCNGFYVPLAATRESIETTCIHCQYLNAGPPVPHGEPLWPERWNCAELQALKDANPAVWEASYQGRPTIGGGYVFDGVQPQFYKSVDAKQLMVYILVDPALARTKKSNRTAIGVVGTGFDQNFYLLDGVYARCNSDERADHIFRLHKKFTQMGARPIDVGYEEYGLQMDISVLQARMERENYRFHISELGRTGEWHNLSKAHRIETLAPLGRAGRIWLPAPDAPGIEPALHQLVKEFLTREWNKYAGASSKDDDFLDMLSRLNDPAMKIAFPSIKMTLMPQTFKRPPGTTWMSA